MAERGVDLKEEKKSYGSVFVIGVALLVALSLWAYWDDNITRRPWKGVQARFYRLDYGKAKAAYDEEDKKLQDDPKYQELSKKLSDIQTSLARGELAKKLQALEQEEAKATVVFKDRDQEVKFIKSELEEAWYEHDHAVQEKRNPAPYLEQIKQLDAAQSKLDPEVEKAQARRDQLREEIKKIKTSGKDLEDELAKMSADRDKWVRVMENDTFKLGPLSFYKIPKIQQVSLNEFDRNRFDQPVARVDRCQTCHLAINRPGFEKEANPFKTHPRREVLLADNAHPPDKFGCTTCHEGQGVAVNSVKQAHGEVALWEFPLLRGASAQSSCTSCHLDVQKFAEDAPLLVEGQRLFEQVGCTGCHLVKGYENIPKIAPSLLKVSAKVDPSWMVRWIENPHKFRPRTRMPNFELKENDAIAIASYIWSQSKEEGDKWAQEHPLPAGLRQGDANSVAQGKKLVESIGCKGCHGFADGDYTTPLGKSKDLVPNLKDIAAKVVGPQWVYHWLKNPRGYSPETRMPSLRLSDDEAASITTYLMTLGTKGDAIPNIQEKFADAQNIKRGEGLVRKWGCFGCHDIKGMEKETRIGAELTTFGSKPNEELFFGNRTDIKETWDDWTYNKLKTPRTYETKWIEQVMPQFDLADEDIKAIRVFLKGRTDAKVPASYKPHHPEEMDLLRGRRLVDRYNCTGCHIIEGAGGNIRRLYEEQPTLAPPILNGEGEKVQSEWLFNFVKAPVPIRPWLKVRMPTFGLSDEEAARIVAYFGSLDRKEIPFVHLERASLTEANIEAGKLLMSKDYLDCFSCHQRGAEKPQGPPEGWAPDLAMAHERLNPEWIVKWIHDPQKVMPGTKMPSFYPGGPPDVLGGDDDAQIRALRDYIISIGLPAPSPQQIAGVGATRPNL